MFSMHYLPIQVFKGINGGGIHTFARGLVLLAARPFLGFQHDSVANLTEIVGTVLTYDNVDRQGEGIRRGTLVVFEMYQWSAVGRALMETLDKMVLSGVLSPKLALSVLLQSIHKRLERQVKSKAFFK
uniref:Transcription initiation factor IIA gamma subunit N-terminal domain-containing protein n=2 Tax=Triticum aestivum TaxID=4565 RepID=A0A3B6FWK2_WHEAT